MALYIGLMSGTSLDGVDAALVELDDDRPARAPRARAHVHRAMPADLHDELLALNRSGADELHRAALASNALMALYAEAVSDVLQAAGAAPREVRAIGAHGQTVRHRPREFDGIGYTLQLMNGALLAERCGIDVACDFRNRDVAAGGQGAPLAPAFHAALFGAAEHPVGVLNLGGIGNLSVLGVDRSVLGFDCGPGNALMDLWSSRHRGEPFDRDGAWAASGRIDRPLLARLLTEPFLALPPPKSTGRDLFNAEWLASMLAPHAPVDPADVMATLAEFTARCASDAAIATAPAMRELLVCGGGAFNAHLMERLAVLLPHCSVASTASRGVPPDQVEALAFAWLAQALMLRRPGNLPSVTGATGPRVLGALYPAT